VGPPFKLVSELYYKSLTDVNTYTIDNVRIRYSASNVAKGYAQGLDFRLNGEFVPGTESWFSFGYLKTEENSEDKGYSQADRSEIEIWTVIPRLHA
jgi:outer membrane receptor protein involved in Fe transport